LSSPRYTPLIESTFLWYQALQKPFFAPPSWIFGPVWTVLYVLIVLSFGYSFIQIIRKRWPLVIATPLLINIVSNLAFTPLQFTLQNNVLAFLDILIVFASIIWVMRAVCPYSRWVFSMQIPYLLWVSFATILQGSITYLNW
jgi:translocator protein